ncbi:MAG TPA: hypothetical protein VFV66_37645, partial [Nonomuraea sp.]|nr:hypothetical protein [Nonomuraea sp.]
NRALVPSTTRRHWNQRTLSPEQRAHMDAQAVAEREAKERNLALGLKALGNAPAPMDLSVFDARAHIAVSVTELEEAVCDKLDITPCPSSATAETITRLISLLDRIALHDDLADHVHREAGRLRQTARIVLGEQEPVVRLRARCPNCDSLSLRAYPERFTVACVDTTCRCDDEDCPCQREESWRHIWPYERWPWLAANLREGIGVAQ